MLLKTASSNTVAVVVINHQIQSSVDGPYNRVNAVSYVSKYMIHLDRYSNSRRLDLSPCHPEADISFAIDERGFTEVADD